MVGFISLIFTYDLLFSFHALILYSTKMWNNLVESSFCRRGSSAEHKDDSRVNMIFLIRIGLQLEFEC